MSFAFKKFNFLQHTEVPSHAWPRNSTSSAASPKHVYVGCDNGSVHVLDGTFQMLTTFQAHSFRVFHVAYLEERRLLLTLGSEEPGFSSTTLKLWDLPNILATRLAAGASIANLTPPQQPVRLVKVFSQKYPEGEVTAMAALEVPPPAAVSSDGSTFAAGAAPTATTVGAGGVSVSGAVLAVAIGLATGMVYSLLLDLPNTHIGSEAGSSKAVGGLASKNSGGPVTAVKPISVSKLSARPDSGHAWAVLGLALHGTSLDSLALFVVTESQTLSYNLRTNTKSVLDAQGVSSPHCTVLRGPRQQVLMQPPRPTPAGADPYEGAQTRVVQPMLMVARDEGLYNFTPDTRAGCTVLEGAKQQLRLLGRFVVVVTQEKSEVGISNATVMVIDLPHKLISGSLTLQSVTAVLPWVCEASSAPTVATASGATTAGSHLEAGAAAAAKPLLVVVTGGNKLYTFKEVPLSMQLESLFKRSLHKLALDLARVHHADPTIIANIQQRWGDALYSKGEYDAAMVQYCDTIGYLEASYVIRRFLDAQRIHNLTSYLELLHDKGIAGADHTTLLLNCYTKLKDVDKLDAFVRKSVVGGEERLTESGAAGASATPGTATPAAPGSPRMTPEAAASTAAAGGKKKVAGAGKKKGRKGSVASVEEIKGAGGDGDAAAGEGKKKAGGPEIKFDAETAVKVLRAAGYPSYALMIARAAHQSDWELDILTEDMAAWDEALTVMERLPRAACAAALKRVGKVLVTSRPERTTGLIMDLCAPSSVRSGSDSYSGSVGDFAHLFCDAPTGLMLLCEFILNTAPPGTITDELYLADTLEDGRSTRVASNAHHQQPEQQPPVAEDPATIADRRERRSKALALLQSGWPPHLEQPKYDQEHALVLCRLAGFKEGLVLLYDRLRLYREVMQVHMSSGDHAALLACVMRYGDVSRGGDPQLWVLLLEYLAQQTTDDIEQRVVEVVQHIEARSILPPIMVLQLLSTNTRLQVKNLRGYVARQLSREVSEAARDREAATRLATETAQLKAELTRLKSHARVFQANRCSATGQPLELPAIHFMCGHAYNARALGDNDKECPLCAPDYRRVVEIRKNMAASALQQDRFFTELRESSDGFSVVADHFGRGLMNMTAGAIQQQGLGKLGIAMVPGDSQSFSSVG